MSKRGKQHDGSLSRNLSLSATLNKAFQSKANWKDKDEFLDVVYWMRQVIGVTIGLLWGILAFKGILSIISFLAINAVIVYIYTNSYQQVDEEEFGGASEILKEGLMTSFASFLITWIILYSALHFD